MSGLDRSISTAGSGPDNAVGSDQPDRRGWQTWGCLASVALLTIAYFTVFIGWVRIALGSDLHSHVILIPPVTIYLLVTGRNQLVWNSDRSLLAGVVAFLISAGLLGWFAFSHQPSSGVDRVAGLMSTYIGFLWAVCLVLLGWRWVRSALFPLGFLLFMIPLPDLAVVHLEHFLMSMSAVVAELLFTAGGIPVFRSGQVLELPGMVLEVAEECSGIRSTWVLFITSVLAAHLFLPTLPRRIILVAAVLPLGILRNAVRIHVIGWLCVHQGPEMIDSWIHRKGGPVFFAASLVPLFLMAWLLRKTKSPRESAAIRRKVVTPV